MCREPLCNRWTRDTVREYYEECWTTVLAAVALLVGTTYGTAFVEGASLLCLCFVKEQGYFCGEFWDGKRSRRGPIGQHALWDGIVFLV
jgi:hypothetical protein